MGIARESGKSKNCTLQAAEGARWRPHRRRVQKHATFVQILRFAGGPAAATLASMLTPREFVSRVTEWVDAFNRGSLDLPDGVLHRDAVFRLNGRPSVSS